MRRLAAAIGRPVTFALTPEQQRPRRRGSGCSTWPAGAAADGVRRAPAGPRPHGVAAARLPDLPPARSSPTVWGEAGLGLLPWQEQVARIQADPELREPPRRRRRAAARQRRSSRGVHAPGPDLRARRPARVRARARAQRRRHRRGARAWTSGSCCSTCCSVDGGRELLNAPVLNYTDGNLDAVGRDAAPPHVRLRARRRRRPRRADLRRVDHHVPALALGPRPRPRPALRRGGRAQDDPGHRHALRARRPRRARPRATSATPTSSTTARCSCTGPSSWPTSPAAPAGSSSGPTATPARSSRGQVTFEGGEDTGARPGALLRGAR